MRPAVCPKIENSTNTDAVHVLRLPQIQSEMAAREAEEEAEKIRQAELEKEKEKNKGAKPKGGKKGGKSRSPSPKKPKGKDSVTSGTPPPGDIRLFINPYFNLP